MRSYILAIRAFDRYYLQYDLLYKQRQMAVHVGRPWGDPMSQKDLTRCLRSNDAAEQSHDRLHTRGT